MSRLNTRRALFAIFTLSGFSGLIYESIWTHYLKLFLGHSAYAQTVVLGIFMGGMAVGAALAAHRSRRWANALRAYAVCEALVGLLALGFHPLFTAFLDVAYGHLIPGLGSPEAVVAFKWISASVLILPQSILLGMTFPLMSAGVLRRFPESPGATLATLYFTNSLGGAGGVLASGFIMIDLLGLHGTIAVAGIANLLLAGATWLIGSPAASAPAVSTGARPAHAASSGASPRAFMALMALTAFLTGLSSLVYEIGWIRMLSLVLGSSTHAFELMLSAFICGLAFGGLWISRRIDRYRSPVLTLAIVQVAMGLLALATLPLYGQTFEFMSRMMMALPKTDPGYQWFTLGSHAIAFVIMLPATFCAGMTLPLATLALLARGSHEGSIGTIYSANTLGAITGVFTAVHFGLPYLGLRDTIMAGAGIDLALGVALLAVAGQRLTFRAAISAAIAGAALAATAFAVQFDALKMASGVYRDGNLGTRDRWSVIAQHDGKTATISLVEIASGVVVIITNGKPDASVNMASTDHPTQDEPTMLLAGAIGPLLKPGTRTIANIGFGSGLTTDIALAFPNIERVDTIEIEPQMVALARGFHPRNARAYEDPRSHIHIDDAKSYFSTRQERYDIIVSEPSNPWVSGVSGLFSLEFYENIKRHLNPGGLLVQWLQLYEIDFELVATILKALDASFEDYTIIATNDFDILIIASPHGAVPALPERLPDLPALRRDLERGGVRSAGDLGLRVLANRRLLHPLLSVDAIPVNSDYRPIVDQRAAKTRFLGRRADVVLGPARSAVPVLPMLGGIDVARGDFNITSSRHLQHPQQAAAARRFAANLAGVSIPSSASDYDKRLAEGVAACVHASGPDAAIAAILRLALDTLAYLPAPEAATVIDWLGTQPCGRQSRGDVSLYLKLMSAISVRDASAMAELGEAILAMPMHRSDAELWLAAGAAIVSHLSQGQREAALKLVARHRARLAQLAARDLTARIILAHAGLTIGRARGSTPDDSPKGQ